MVEVDKNIVDLGDQNNETLNRKGWFLVTYYQSRESGEGSSANNKAMEKAFTLKKQAGIRSYVKEDITFWEVWERW